VRVHAPSPAARVVAPPLVRRMSTTRKVDDRKVELETHWNQLVLSLIIFLISPS